MSGAVELPAETEQQVEILLLRNVYEQARSLLRYSGIDQARVTTAIDQMDAACEQVKLFDGGLMDDEDKLRLLASGEPAADPAQLPLLHHHV